MNRDYKDTITHKDYSIDPSTQHMRNVRTNIASKHISSSPQSAVRTPHIGDGRLHDSIMGPQYFHDSSTPIPPQSEATEIPRETNAPEIRTTGDPVWINKLPGSQDSEEGSDDNKENHHQPPFGDPNDPNNPDDGRPPRWKPPGGPPRGPPGQDHQVEDHLKDHQGIQIHGYHTFPEGGHLHQEDLHKGCHHQGCCCLHCQHLRTIKEPTMNSDLTRESRSQTYLHGTGMAKLSWNGSISSTISPIAAMSYSPI